MAAQVPVDQTPFPWTLPDSFSPSKKELESIDLKSEHVVDAVIAIGNERKKLLLRMRAAVRDQDLQSVFTCAQELVGFEPNDPSHEERN